MKTNADEEVGEARNFQAFEGRCYGYAPVNSGTLNMKRLGGRGDESDLDGVLVIWTATSPAESRRYVVGWYKDDTVYKKMSSIRPGDRRIDVVVEASAENCYVVPVDERTFEIPFQRAGWPGISSAFYASDTLAARDLGQVTRYVDGHSVKGLGDDRTQETSAQRRDGSQDPELRAKVEEASIKLVVGYYRELRYVIESVEKENCGWDLTASRNGRSLFIEVKGRSNSGTVEITPNEYAAMRSPKLRMSYRLAVVREALKSSPSLTIFSYAPPSRNWMSDAGDVLSMKEATAAIVNF